jgi:integrase
MCQHKVYTFIQTMRWTGLAIGDAMRLRRDALKYDEEKDLYRVTTKRKKTGVPVSNPVPTDVAEDLLKIENASPVYFFWSGHGKVQSATSNWGQRYIAPCFKAAGIESEGNMLSHRLRDTFAVDLLEKGVPMEEVSKLLGQTSIRTTEKHYAKWSKGRQDRLDTLVSGTWETPKKPMRRGPKPKVVAIA